MIAGNIGSKNTVKYQCIGQQVNLAGRIESYSVGGQVLISKSTYDNISADVEIKKHPEGRSQGNYDRAGDI